MDQPLETNQVLKALNWRFATKEFTDKRVPPEKISALIEAVRLSPSCFNTQPWRLIHVTDERTIRELLPVMHNQTQVKTTHDLFIFCTNTDLEHTLQETMRVMSLQHQPAEAVATYGERLGKMISGMDSERRMVFAQRQLYIALGTFLTAAALYGIDAGPMEGLDPDGVSRVLKLPPTIRPYAAAPIGYRKAEPTRQKVRVPLGAMYERR